MKRSIAALPIAVVAALAGWHFRQPEQPKQNAQAQAPAASVTTAVAQRATVPVLLAANGTVSPLNSVDVRPQVSNVVAKVHIKEGQFVKSGDILFSLDDRADRVNLQKAQAQLAKDQASLSDLERQLARSRDLLSRGFIAQSATDTVQAQVDAARAALQADVAAVAAARVALGYDTIRAASSGRAGAISVYAGSLVQPASPPLVTISQLDPIAITFTLPEAELNSVLDAQKAGPVKVTAKGADNSAPLEGTLSFVDNTVDAQNGTIKMKATFPNAQHRLWPGQYVAVNTTVRALKDAIVIPQAAIITGIDAKTVYVVDADKTAQARKIDVLYAFGTQAAVTGVLEGDRVVVDGKQNLRPGSKIRQADAAPGADAKKTRKDA